MYNAENIQGFLNLVNDVKVSFSDCDTPEAIETFNRWMDILTEIVQATKQLSHSITTPFELSGAIELTTAKDHPIPEGLEYFEVRLFDPVSSVHIWYCRLFIGMYKTTSVTKPNDKLRSLLEKLEHPCEGGVLSPMYLLLKEKDTRITYMNDNPSYFIIDLFKDFVFLSASVNADEYKRYILTGATQHSIH